MDYMSVTKGGSVKQRCVAESCVYSYSHSSNRATFIAPEITYHADGEV